MKKPHDPSFLDISMWLRSAWLRPFLPIIETLAGIRAINRVHRRAAPRDGNADAFSEAVLRELGVTWRLVPPPTPSTGKTGTLVLANHPTGMIEALILMRLLESLAPQDWKILTNPWIASKPEFSRHSIPLDPFGWDADAAVNLRGLRQVFAHLKQGGVVGAFPSGRVAGKRDRRGRALDEPWSPHLIRIARRAGARIMLVHIPLCPGLLLRLTPLRWPMLRSLLLPREALRRRPCPLLVKLFPAPDDLPDNDPAATRILYELCHKIDPSTPH